LHLLSSSVFIVVLLLGVTSIPLLYFKHVLFAGNIKFLIAPVTALLISFGVLALMYLATFARRDGSWWAGFKRLFRMYIPFLSFSMGLSLHNTIAVIQGYSGKKTPFIRTPKFNVDKENRSWKHVKYTSKKVKPGVIGEWLMVAYFGWGIWMALDFQDYSILPFFLMQGLGFAAIAFFSLRHALQRA
ncbi:MAG: hypothetical protein AAF399_09390, partial [Bacteroidota bacterium]